MEKKKVNKKEKKEVKKKESVERKEKVVSGEKKRNIISRHKLLFLLCFLAFVVCVVLFYIFFSLFIGGNDPYGNRLKGINSVKITSKLKKDVTASLTSKDEVSDASVRVQGKIIYVHIYVKENVGLDTAKAIANEVLGSFDDDMKKFYDFGFFVKQEKENGFVATGTKNSNSDKIVWIKS